MSYTPPVVFTTATPVTADDLNNNNDALRKYINRNVVQADLSGDAFGTTDILKGEYSNVVQDHQFTTGDIYTQNKLANNATERSFYTSTYKPLLYSQWGETGQFQIVMDTGKSIYFEGHNGSSVNSNLAAKLVITGHIGVRNYHQYVFANINGGGTGSVYDYSQVSTTSPLRQRTRFHLAFKIEGLTDGWVRILNSLGKVCGFEETQNSTDPFGTNQLKDRRTIPFLYQVDIPNLWANISPEPMPQDLAWRFAIVVEPSVDLGWVNHRIMQYEVFYA
jgi:hypothetical protein